jgi:hypothetical protein
VKEYTFTARLAVLLSINTVVAIINSYVPHDLSPVRWLITAVQLVFIIITMAFTMRRVLEDY